ncbi:hypothetical protein ACQKGD_27570, partial [Peribacillus frigoritolerans]|uniref:hypothetical protein n=1 Tax=Peribacillus frigoritolerans TaxID=450367 RepID=UPI003D037D1E
EYIRHDITPLINIIPNSILFFTWRRCTILWLVFIGTLVGIGLIVYGVGIELKKLWKRWK